MIVAIMKPGSTQTQNTKDLISAAQKRRYAAQRMRDLAERELLDTSLALVLWKRGELDGDGDDLADRVCTAALLVHRVHEATR